MTRAVLSELLRAAAPVACLLAVGCSNVPGQGDSLPGQPPAVAAVPAEEQALAARAQAIAAYRDYLQRYPDSAERDRISRRLADLLVEQAAELALAEQRDDPAAESVNRRARLAYEEAIDLYQGLLVRHPTDPDNAEILYQLSRAYQATGNSRMALETVQELVARGPAGETGLYADNLFRRAELLFAEGDYVEAAGAYRSLVALGASTPAYEQSLYKLGWSLFRAEHYRDALGPWFAFLDLRIGADGPAQNGATAVPPATAEQVAEVLQLTGSCFARSGGVDAIEPYFSEHGRPDYAPQVYLGLADWYVEQGRVSAAATTWQSLASREPLAARAPMLLIRAIALYEEAGFEQPALAARRHFVETYAMEADYWQHHSPAGAPEVVRSLQSSLQLLAARASEQAHDGDVAAVREAENWYREYLRWFPQAPAAAQMNFDLAQLLYRDGRYLQALQEYERIAWLQADQPLAQDAALGALRAVDAAREQAGAAEAPSLAEREIAVGTRFLDHYPEHQMAPGVLAGIGGDLLQQQAFDRAAALGMQSATAARVVSDEFRQVGWALHAQAMYRLEDYPAAAGAYRKALAFADNDDPRYAALQSGLAAATWEQGAAALTAGDSLEAARLYRQAAEVAPEEAMRARAIYDEGVALLAGESWVEAAATFERYRHGFPSAPLESEANLKLAYAYSRAGEALRAAEAYQRVAQDPALDVAVQREALLEAVELFEQAGAGGRAMTAREQYIERFPEPADVAISLMQQLALAASASGNSRQADRWREEIIRRDQSAGSPGTHGIAASAALGIAENRMSDFRRISLVQPMREHLDRKVAAMNQAVAALERSIGFGIPAVTAQATHHIASLYEELGRAILESERPLDLTTEELSEYDALLANQAHLFEQRAIAVYSANADRAGAGGGDPWVAKSVRRLDELQHGR